MAVTNAGIKISADAREVRKAGQEIKQAFSPKALREFKQATRDVEQQLSSLTRKQADLTRQLSGLEKGTKAYKELKEQLKGVSDQAGFASTALSQLDRIQQRSARQMQMGAGRNFLAGMAQGTGVAQYIPSGPGMGARVGGAMLGGAARGAGRIAAAPFMTPGIAGMAQGLSGIPIVGGFAAGALQTAAGAYQSAVAYDRARLQNLFFAGPQMGQISADSARGPGLSRSAALAQARREIQPARQFAAPAISEEAREQAARAQGMLLEQGFNIRRGGRMTPPPGFRMTPETSKLMNQASAGMMRLNVSPAEQTRVDEARKRRVKELTAGRGAALSGLGTTRLGTQLGFTPTQVQGMMGQFFQGRGGLAAPEAQAQFRESMSAQIRFGVTQGQAGQFARLGMVGGGGTGMTGLAQVLQGAFVQGLRGSQVPEYLQTLVGLGAAAEKQGIKLNVQEFSKMTMQLNRAGLQGLQAQRVAGGLIQGMQGLSARGVQTPVDVMMMRAAGFKPGQGPEGYFTAVERLESPDQALLNNLLTMVSAGGRGIGGPKARAGLAKRLFGKMGVGLGMGQASQILEAYQQGRPPDINDLLASQEAMGGAGAMERRARRMVGIGAPTVGAAAGLEAQRVELGQKAAVWVVKFEQNSMKAAQAMNNFSGSLTKMAELSGKALDSLNKLTTGGVDGITGRILRALGIDFSASSKGKPSTPKAR